MPCMCPHTHTHTFIQLGHLASLVHESLLPGWRKRHEPGGKKEGRNQIGVRGEKGVHGGPRKCAPKPAVL